MFRGFQAFVMGTLLAVGCSETGTPDILGRSAADTITDPGADCNQEQDEATDDPADYAAASQEVGWQDGNAQGTVVPVKLLALNDFHGQISKGKKANGHPAGGAAVLAAYLKAAFAGVEDHTFIASAGDFVGASAPSSGLLEDEPAIMFLNQLANAACQKNGNNYDPSRCNIISTLGNHEFDKGRAELFRKLNGGNSVNGPYLVNPWPGASYPYVCANAVDSVTGAPLLPPYQIKQVGGESIAFIGAVTVDTPNVTVASGVTGVTFLDEATAINKYIPDIQQQGVHAIVVLIHEGGRQHTYTGSTLAGGAVSGRLPSVVARLDADVDVVLSGHSHAFTNALLPNAGGRPTLVTQAFSYSTAFANLDLQINTSSHDVTAKSARIVMAYADSGPGLTPDAAAASLVAQAEALIAPKVNQVVGSTNVALLRAFFPLPFVVGTTPSGESNLGDLIADAQRAAMGTQLSLMNPGGIRADYTCTSYPCALTWGTLYGIQPFANNLVSMQLKGADLLAALEQQWQSHPTGSPCPAVQPNNLLQVSGLTITWSSSAVDPPACSRHIVQATVNGVALDTAAVYTVTANSFLAGGGDSFFALRNGASRVTGPVDLDALVSYTQTHSPVNQSIEGRLIRTQ